MNVKASIYARAAITDYWVVDIPSKLVHLHRSPENGSYTNIVEHGFDDEISPWAAPTMKICLNKL